MTVLRRVVLPANAVSLLLAGLFLLSWAVVPSFEQVRADTLPSDRWLLDRHGAPLQVQRVDERIRRLGWTPLDQVSPMLRRAVIATEDPAASPMHSPTNGSVGAGSTGAGGASRALGGLASLTANMAKHRLDRDRGGHGPRGTTDVSPLPRNVNPQIVLKVTTHHHR